MLLYWKHHARWTAWAWGHQSHVGENASFATYWLCHCGCLVLRHNLCRSSFIPLTYDHPLRVRHGAGCYRKSSEQDTCSCPCAPSLETDIKHMNSLISCYRCYEQMQDAVWAQTVSWGFSWAKPERLGVWHVNKRLRGGHTRDSNSVCKGPEVRKGLKHLRPWFSTLGHIFPFCNK